MLGSMLTNLLFVFGVSCLVGGLRWQVQELRITSGNVSVLLLLVATAGSLLPAALNMSGQMKEDDLPDGKPSEDELAFSRINAFIMVSMYISYLMFQLGTHKEEFDEEDNIVETPDNVLLMSPYFTSRHPRRKRAERNRFCLKWFDRGSTQSHRGYSTVELLERGQNKAVQSDLATTDIMDDSNVMIDSSDISDTDEENTDVERQQNGSVMIHRKGSGLDTQSLPSLDTGSKRSHRGANLSNSFEAVTEDNNDSRKPNGGSATQIKSNDSEIILQGAQEEALQSGSAHSHQTEQRK
jgi:Ca2+/Na+ antiporter